MDKYLFLDFDGVLNTTGYAKRLRKEGIDPFDGFGTVFAPFQLAIEVLNNKKQAF